MASYRSIDEVLNGVSRSGWRIVGLQPQYTETTSKDPDTGQQVKTQKQTSTVWSIQSPDGTQTDTMEVGDVPDPNVKGGVAINVLKAPSKNLSAGSTAKPSATAALDRIDAQGRVIPPDDTTTRPAKLRDPATGTVTDLPDPKQGAQPSGQFNNIIDPRDPAGKRIIGVVDTGDNSYHQLPAEADPTTGRQIVNTGTKILAVDKDNNVTTLATVDKSSPFQAINIDGKLFRFDPNETDISKSLQPMGDQTPAPVRDAQNNPMVWDKDQGKYVYAPGVTPASTVSTNTTSPFLIWYDQQGNEVKRQKNDNYVPPTPTQLTADTSAPNIPLLKTDGTVQWVPNQNRVTAGQAMQDLLSQVGAKVNGNQMSMADAKDMLTGAVNTMNAQTSRMNAQTAQQQAANQQAQTTQQAAGDILTNTRTNAQTAAGLINQRVQAATGTLQSILGNALSNKNVTSYPSDIGGNLVQGLQGWTAELAGGQPTLDSAARMVQMADPKSDLADPSTQHAIGVLTQMLDKYQDITGAPHPAVAATQAAAQSQQQGGITAPNTATPAVQAVQATPAVGAGFTPPGGSSYSYPSVPWAGATPQTLQSQAGAGVGAGFVAPPMAPRTAPVTVTIG
jgi:hypothetical protein